MSKTQEALKMAICQMKAYAFKHLYDYQRDDKELLEVIKVCEEALAELEQVEPFGYFKAEPFGWTDCADTDEGAIALYENPPPKREWVGLSDEVIDSLAKNGESWNEHGGWYFDADKFAKAIEAKLKEVNGYD